MEEIETSSSAGLTVNTSDNKDNISIHERGLSVSLLEEETVAAPILGRKISDDFVALPDSEGSFMDIRGNSVVDEDNIEYEPMRPRLYSSGHVDIRGSPKTPNTSNKPLGTPRSPSNAIEEIRQRNSSIRNEHFLERKSSFNRRSLSPLQQKDRRSLSPAHTIRDNSLSVTGGQVLPGFIDDTQQQQTHQNITPLRQQHIPQSYRASLSEHYVLGNQSVLEMTVQQHNKHRASYVLPNAPTTPAKDRDGLKLAFEPTAEVDLDVNASTAKSNIGSCCVLNEVNTLELDKKSTHFYVFGIILMIFACFSIIIEPYRIAFVGIHTHLQVFDWIMITFDMIGDSIYIIALIIELIFSKKIKKGKTSVNVYLRTWFIVDFLAVLPLDFFQLAHTPIGIYPWYRILKLLRATQLKRNDIQSSTKGTNSPDRDVLISIGKLFMFLSVVSHISACIKFAIGESESFDSYTLMDGHDQLQRYLISYYWALGTITGLGVSNVPGSYFDSAYTLILMAFGICFFAYIVGSIRGTVESANINRREFQQLINYTTRFMINSNIPEHIRYRAKQYFDYVWTTERGQSIDFLVNDFPIAARADFLIHLAGPVVSKAKIFAELHPGFLAILVQHLKLRIAVPDEIVTKQGDPGDEMFFLQEGEVRVILGIPPLDQYGSVLPFEQGGGLVGMTPAHYSNNNCNVVSTMKEGSVFGEYSLLTEENSVRTATIQSVYYAKLLVLTREGLYTTFSQFPQEIFDIVCERAKKDRTKTKKNDEEAKAEHKLETINSFDNDNKLFMIDPHGKLRKYLIMVVQIIFLYNAIMIPFRMGFLLTEVNGLLIFLDYTGDIILWFYCLSHFRTPFYKRGNLVSNLHRIKKHYMKGFFVLHCIGLFPLDFFMIIFGYSAAWRVNKILFTLEFLHMMSESLKESYNFEILKLRNLLFDVFLLQHWVACAYYSFTGFEGFADPIASPTDTEWSLARNEWLPLQHYENAPILYQYLRSFFYAISVAGRKYHFYPSTEAEIALSIAVMSVGVFVVAYLIGSVGAVISNLDVFHAEHVRKLSHFQDFTNVRRVPKFLVERIERSLNHRWKKYNGVEPDKALDNLPVSLSTDIKMFLCHEMMLKVPYFNDLDTHFLRSLCQTLQFASLPAGEVVFYQGQVGFEMYFIQSGYVNIQLGGLPRTSKSLGLDWSYTNIPIHRTLIKTIGPGSFFGEGMMFHQQRNASASTCTEVSLFVLSINSLSKLYLVNEVFRNNIKEINHRRTKNVLSMQSSSLGSANGDNLAYEKEEIRKNETTDVLQEFMKSPKERLRNIQKNEKEDLELSKLINQGKNYGKDKGHRILKSKNRDYSSQPIEIESPEIVASHIEKRSSGDKETIRKISYSARLSNSVDSSLHVSETPPLVARTLSAPALEIARRRSSGVKKINLSSSSRSEQFDPQETSLALLDAELSHDIPSRKFTLPPLVEDKDN